MGQSGLIDPTVNDFERDLAYSLKSRDELFWGEIYKKAFPNLTRISLCDDLDLQFKGVDRYIHLENGNVLKVDEKKRRRFYHDILLEYVSSDKTGAPGWMEKDLVIDYLAYAFMDIQRVYFFPWLMLKRAWDHFKVDWYRLAKAKHDGFRIVEAQNKGYKTHSIAVPTKVLRRAVSTAAIIDLKNELDNVAEKLNE